MKKTHDYVHHYRGYWSEGGRCRIRIYEGEGQAPVVICSELPDNHNTSVTNMAEYLAAELMREHPETLNRHNGTTGTPFIWIEHYPRDEKQLRLGFKEEWDKVFFSDYKVREVNGGFGRRVKIGTPEWRWLERAEVEQMIGERLDVQDSPVEAALAHTAECRECGRRLTNHQFTEDPSAKLRKDS